MKEHKVDGFCYGEDHKRCFFYKEMPNGTKFCGLWMRNIKGAINPRKQAFRSLFCNVKKVTIESNGGPAYNEQQLENKGSISISNT